MNLCAGAIAASAQQCAEVAVFAPLPQALSYTVPAHLAAVVVPGGRVRVPLGRRSAIGVVTALRGVKDEQWELKPILEYLDAEVPVFDPSTLAFIQRVSAYYVHPPGLCMKTALPAGLTRQTPPPPRHAVSYRSVAGAHKVRGPVQQAVLDFIAAHDCASIEQIRTRFPSPYASLKRLEEKGLIVREEHVHRRDPFAGLKSSLDSAPPLSDEQADAVASICTSAGAAGGFEPFLLHGVTGSGKTEVYLRSIAHVVQEMQRQALVLVPEISLTPQLVKRFRARFEHLGVRIGVMHSGMGIAERHDIWREINHGQLDIVIGARSAIFAPLSNLGIIVVDEEHDESYKQGEGLRYNARDMALLRGQMLQIPVVLGSATPALTSFYRAQNGQMALLNLSCRVMQRTMPTVELIDLSAEPKATIMAPQLLEAIRTTLEAGEQVMLLLNRRGFSPYLICRDCGATFRCPNCDITLTWYRSQKRLKCNYCDFTRAPDEVCPQCGGATIEPRGAGTEQLEHLLQESFPAATVARMDRDSTRTKGAQQQLVMQMENRDVDILVGTQMVAKGHDFPAVTLVGVIDADAALNFPDFRAAERCFSLLAQVAGRAGRGETPGKVLVQTRCVENPVLHCALNHDYMAFCTQEMPMRKLLGYPPYGYLVNMVCSGLNRSEVEQGACQMARQFAAYAEIEVLGPAPCPLFRLRNRFRVQILLKAALRRPLRTLLAALPRLQATLPPRVSMTVDVDPMDMM